jgi:membrane-bound ClpP family serine protease
MIVAAIISLILIVLGLITYFLDLSENKALQWVGYIIFIIAVIWSVSNYGKQLDYNSTFGNYFSHGFKITALVTLFMIIFTFLFIYLFPDIKEKGLEAARKGMVEKNMTQEQITQAMGFTQKFFMVFVIGAILVFYLFFGAIASLIGAGVTKKNPVQFTDGR